MPYKKYFPYFEKNKDEIYFDSAATAAKLGSVIAAEAEYMTHIGANPHSNDFKNAIKSSEILKNARIDVANFINANRAEEIIFTSGSTHALNQIAFGLKGQINKGDSIVITKLEHSSNHLPWLILADEKNANLKFAHLLDNGNIDITKINEVVDGNTKIFSFAHVTNTMANENDVKKIVDTVKQINPNTIVIVDCAQSVAHCPIDVKDWDVEFIVFSAHKMFGPFGLGILWGKYERLDTLSPIFYGGGNNLKILESGYKLKALPDKLEAGTPNIGAIYAFGKVFEFYKENPLKELASVEVGLKHYAVSKIKDAKFNDIEFYNLENDQPILLFNKKGVNPHDLGIFLSKKYNISVRTGAHCARGITDFNDQTNTLRASFSFYNTKEEVDILINALENSDSWPDALF